MNKNKKIEELNTNLVLQDLKIDLVLKDLKYYSALTDSESIIKFKILLKELQHNKNIYNVIYSQLKKLTIF